jgi:hypothetical protein
MDVGEKYLRTPPEDTTWNDLQLESGHKRDLDALVKRHFKDKSANESLGQKATDFDFVAGKGRQSYE